MKFKKKTVNSFTVNYVHSETLMHKKRGESYNTFPMTFRVLLDNVCIVFSFFAFSNCKNIFYCILRKQRAQKIKNHLPTTLVIFILGINK